MNWKDDQIEKLILFYSHNSLFLVPDFWYQKSCNWCQKLVPVSGQYVMGIRQHRHSQFIITIIVIISIVIVVIVHTNINSIIVTFIFSVCVCVLTSCGPATLNDITVIAN